MEHLNPVDQARQLAAEVVKRLGQLNLHRRELERKLHVANGFFTSLEEKNNMTLLLFFEVKAVIEEHYERRIEFTGMSTRRCHGRRNVNWGSGREK